MEETLQLLSNHTRDIFVRRGRRKCFLYVIFAAYTVVVFIIIVSMLWRLGGPGAGQLGMGGGLPKYLTDDQMKLVAVHRDGTSFQQLENAFHKADGNQNNYLEEKELSDWLRSKVSEHITSAVRNNINTFLTLDTNPKDGWISWNEYQTRFITFRGAQNESELTRPIREQLRRERAEFDDAASESGRLNVDDLLRFLHPEANHARMLETVTELIDNLDDDGDMALSSAEFLLMSSDGYRPSEAEAVFPLHSKQEMRQLHSQLDTDGDGRISQQELLVYIDPRHASHAAREASRLLQLADRDADRRLSLAEVQAQPDPLRVIVDARHKFHSVDDLR